jgi:hypothetical protein
MRPSQLYEFDIEAISFSVNPFGRSSQYALNKLSRKSPGGFWREACAPKSIFSFYAMFFASRS